MKLLKVFIAVAALLLPISVVAQNFDIDLTTYDYGAVEVGDSALVIFTLTSVGPDTPVQIDDVVLDCESGPCQSYNGFEITSVTPEDPRSLSVTETMEIEVVFAPSAAGMYTVDLLIVSDAHDNGPLLYVPLQGEGIAYEPPPDELIAEAMAFYAMGLADGTIYGLGNGNAPIAHQRVFGNMLDAADDLIAVGDFVGACKQLEHLVVKSDGESRPPDLIGGLGVPSLNAMIIDIMATLGC